MGYWHWNCSGRFGCPSMEMSWNKIWRRWEYLMERVVSIGISQGGLDAHSWRCQGIRHEGDGNFFMEWVVKDWNSTDKFGIHTPGGVQGIPRCGTPGLDDRLNSMVPEAFSNLSHSLGFCGTKGNLPSCSWGWTSPARPRMTHPEIPKIFCQVFVSPGSCSFHV